MIYTRAISLLTEKLFHLLRPQSFSFQLVSVFVDTIIGTLCSKGRAFDSLFCPEERVFVHNDCPRRRVFAPFKSCPRGLSGGLDEIDTCISHRHGKSDMARPSYPCKSKMCRIFLITKQLRIKNDFKCFG